MYGEHTDIYQMCIFTMKSSSWMYKIFIILRICSVIYITLSQRERKGERESEKWEGR